MVEAFEMVALDLTVRWRQLVSGDFPIVFLSTFICLCVFLYGTVSHGFLGLKDSETLAGAKFTDWEQNEGRSCLEGRILQTFPEVKFTRRQSFMILIFDHFLGFSLDDDFLEDNSALWDMLTKSALILEGVDDAGRLMEYRHRNLQWRTGLASGSQGEAGGSTMFNHPFLCLFLSGSHWKRVFLKILIRCSENSSDIDQIF